MITSSSKKTIRRAIRIRELYTVAPRDRKFAKPYTERSVSKQLSLSHAIAALVPDGSSIVLGCQMEQMIPFAAGHELIRQKKRGLTLIGPISDVLFDQLIGAGSAQRVIAAWVGNVMMGS